VAGKGSVSLVDVHPMLAQLAEGEVEPTCPGLSRRLGPGPSVRVTELEAVVEDRVERLEHDDLAALAPRPVAGWAVRLYEPEEGRSGRQVAVMYPDSKLSMKTDADAVMSVAVALLSAGFVSMIPPATSIVVVLDSDSKSAAGSTVRSTE
jgi:hypothetical protein